MNADETEAARLLEPTVSLAVFFIPGVFKARSAFKPNEVMRLFLSSSRDCLDSVLFIDFLIPRCLDSVLPSLASSSCVNFSRSSKHSKDIIWTPSTMSTSAAEGIEGNISGLDGTSREISSPFWSSLELLSLLSSVVI